MKTRKTLKNHKNIHRIIPVKIQGEKIKKTLGDEFLENEN